MKSYLSLNILYAHIDNHSSYLKHKKKISNAKSTIESQRKIRFEVNKSKEKNELTKLLMNERINNENKLLKSKLNHIYNRNNECKINTNFDSFSKIIVNSKQAINSMKQEKIKEENKRDFKKIKDSQIVIDNKDFENNYQNHLNYMKFNNSFNLPKIHEQT
jgi:archaellum biogenesis ATPase FlaH